MDMVNQWFNNEPTISKTGKGSKKKTTGISWDFAAFAVVDLMG